ncbi:DUF1304 domain-containing protein [Algoriphagus hitonicola]|uniref:Putative membrane protein n=1 Tax=Algoriphagus hitonicola TaxID=435880 RepID=A0A1I2QSA9_9BACT|nr:DUF1304 domain-containing protein [Algoriphagus hitonicola]SFG30543.1 putative membrane protein [Algoriphagus hitonicola]
MTALIYFLVGIVAFQHLLFFWMEAMVWESFGRKVFGGTREFFKSTKSLAANQGLYNGFLAGGLIWSFFVQPDFAWQIQVFFLFCVWVAGIFGAFTVSKKIFWVQGLPAMITLILIMINR